MKITHMEIHNFRAHVHTEIPISQFGCLIGENNAGKSSVLHALRFALEGSKLIDADFADLSQPVSVSVQLEDISEQDLLRVTNLEHRDRIRGMVVEGSLGFVREMRAGERITLSYQTWAPKSAELTLDALNTAIKDARGKAVREKAVAHIPALDSLLDDTTTITKVRLAHETYVSQLDKSELKVVNRSVPTGIPASFNSLLPEVIYIEAVKDASSEAKTTDSSIFGKLLKLLFQEVETEFDDLAASFLNVQRKLSRIYSEEETIDERLEQVVLIEETIESFIQESFPGITLTMDVPGPTLTTILSQAQLKIDDGHEGLIGSKGDGLQRTALFAILRAYTKLRQDGLQGDAESDKNADEDAVEGKPTPSYLLLFEEPELYLHPRAQRQLMRTLERFSEEHQVLVTTHSPGFFGAFTTGFAKLQKHDGGGVSVYPVDLKVDSRNQYQLVHYENNEAAFFARNIVLVEGESDVVVFPHLARLLNPEWDHQEKNIMFVKISGKGNVKRYRSFFRQFGVEVHVITDLDVLADGFSQVVDESRDEESPNTLYSQLMQKVKALTEKQEVKLNGRAVRKMTRENPTAVQSWNEAQEIWDGFSISPTSEQAEKLRAALEPLFSKGDSKVSLAALQGDDPDICELRDDLITALYDHKVYILKRGDLETYYGGEVSRVSKVSKAGDYLGEVSSLEIFKMRHGEDADSVTQELAEIFGSIFVD